MGKEKEDKKSKKATSVKEETVKVVEEVPKDAVETKEVKEKSSSASVSAKASNDEKATDDKKIAKVKRKKKGSKNIAIGNAFVKATFNNTIITITDIAGNVIANCSAGAVGYSGAKKSTPYVAGLIANNVVTKAKGHGMTEVNVFVKGIGSGRESAVRALQSSGLNIISIKDVTPLPHNGCKRQRARRV